MMVSMIVMIISNNFDQELRRLIPLYGPIRLFQIKNKASRDKEVTLLSE